MKKNSIPGKNKGVKPERPPVTSPDEATAPLSAVPAELEADTPNVPAFAIVGIGASAGGLQSFTEMISRLDAKLDMGYIYVQHLDPTHPSSLVQLLQRQTSMPIFSAETGMRVEPNHVYVIPPNVTMLIRNGMLELAPRPDSRRLNMPVDMFFKSLAEEQKSRSIGVVLSGTASDGAIGLQAIKAAGGITFAQDPVSAEYDGMPRSAIAAGCVDFVQTPAVIAEELARISRHPYVSPAVSRPAELLLDSEQSFSNILAMLRNATGVDFNYYKSSTIKRRLLRRMALNRVDSVERYVAFLRSHPPELRALFDDILINVTEFFRDVDMFQTLRTTVFPEISPPGARRRPLRIWVPGCSTGEEVYSLAMCLLEYLDDRAGETQIQIFASDISERALDIARAGVYSDTIAQDVSPARLRRFFTRLESGYQINKRIREMCVFAKQNLAKDPPFSKLDLISCRNVLIYMGPVLQKRILPFFHYALKPSGYLVLGSSEAIGSFSELFTIVDKKNKVYLRKPVTSHVPLDFSMADNVFDPRETPRRVEEWNEPELARDADRIVLSMFGPPGAVIDDDLNILQFRGHTGPYFEPASGIASLSLLKMVREGLLVEVRNAVQKARRDNAPVRREGLHVKHENVFKGFDLEVIPLKRPPGKDRRFLLLFLEPQRRTPQPPPRSTEKPIEKAAGKKKLSPPQIQALNEQLRRDLEATKEYLQSIIEEQEASNEELRSANEEIQSSNEELQSTNEELETTKEELQSANEELNTVNEELQTRNVQLSQVGNDLLNLLSNVSIPIVMLGNDLRIRRFTPISEKVLNLIPSDIGRPVSDIKFTIEVPHLESMLLEVLESLTPKTLEVRDRSGRAFSLRIRPYRTEDNRIEGIVLVMVDLDPSQGVVSDTDVAARLVDAGTVAPGPQAHLRNTAEQIRAFAGMLIEAQEEERRRVARELHDDMGQKLAALEMDVAKLQPNLSAPEDGKSVLTRLQRAVGDLTEGLRRIAHQLHPPVLDDLGLVVAIQSYCRQFTEREGVNVNFRHNEVPPFLGSDTQLALYRIVQEALRNVARHSRAEEVTVSLLSLDGSLNLAIKDNGIGFDTVEALRTSGLGLIGMQERVRLQGGHILIRSSPGKGADILVQLPLNPGGLKTTEEVDGSSPPSADHSG